MTSGNDGVFLSIEEQRSFDWATIVVDEPVTKTFVKDGDTIVWTTSKVYAPGANGKKLPIYIELPQQNFRGLYVIDSFNPFGEPTEGGWLVGYEIFYPLTSYTTVHKPTKAEKTCKRTLDNMWNITVDAMKKFCSVKDKSKRRVPTPTYNSYVKAKDKDDWTHAVKPIYYQGCSKDESTDEWEIDEDKPQLMRIKLLTRGKGHKLRCDTKIYGPGDKEMSPYDCKLVRGDGHPVIRWDGIFWGSHGKTGYGASLRFRVTEMNFTPTSDKGYNPSDCYSVPKRRMLVPNKQRD